MTDDSKTREFARGEARSKIHWGADVDEVLDLLHTKYGIGGDEADVIVAEAVTIRKRSVRKKAAIGLVFAALGLALSITYFAIQRSAGFVVIGFGPILMGALGLASLAMAGRSFIRVFSGESSGPV